MGLIRTPLFEAAQAADGRMVPFAGWEMAVQFGGVKSLVSLNFKCQAITTYSMPLQYLQQD